MRDLNLWINQIRILGKLRFKGIKISILRVIRMDIIIIR
jgi:hypothetical protein